MAIPETRTSALLRVIERRLGRHPATTLVVGCGNGREAAVLARQLQAKVVGIDLVPQFDPEAARFAELRQGDATALDFTDQSFDLVFSYHALEHISDPMLALREMRRVLRPEGRYCIGTPNRGRLVGYVGGPSTWGEKLRWNAADWRARLAGRFRNEYGAHAGFTSRELQELLTGVFTSAEDVSAEYYESLYSEHRWAVRLASLRPVRGVVFPSVYFVGDR